MKESRRRQLWCPSVKFKTGRMRDRIPLGTIEDGGIRDHDLLLTHCTMALVSSDRA